MMNDQRSTTDQLLDLVRLANEHGLYDAADAVQQLIARRGLSPLTDQEKMVYAAAYAKVYVETYPGYEHCIAAARAVRAAYHAVEALHVMHALLDMNQTIRNREVALVAEEFTRNGRVTTVGEHIEVPHAVKTLFDRFMK